MNVEDFYANLWNKIVPSTYKPEENKSMATKVIADAKKSFIPESKLPTALQPKTVQKTSAPVAKEPILPFTTQVIPKIAEQAISKWQDTAVSNVQRRAQMPMVDLAKEDIGKVGNAFKIMLDATKQIVQAPIRTGISALQSGLESSYKAALGKEYKQDIDLTNHPVLQALVGAPKLESFQTKSQRGEVALKRLGASQGEAFFYPVAGLTAGSILDFTGFGGETKNILKNITEDEIKYLAKEIDKDAISAFLIQKGVPAKEAFSMAEPMAKTATPEAVREVVGHATKLESTKGAFNVDEYIGEQVAKRETARKSTNEPSWYKELWPNIKKSLVDSQAPIEDAIRSAEKKTGVKLSPLEDFHSQVDIAKRSNDKAGMFMKDEGLEDAIKVAGNDKNFNEFEQYLTAKRAIDVNTRGFETGRDFTKDTLLVNALNEKWAPVAKVVYDYSNKLLDTSVDYGLVSPELAKILKEAYPEYVPMNRVFNELEKEGGAFGSNAVGGLSKQTVIQKLEGSSREIESPFASLVDKTYQTFKQGEKNKTARILVDDAAQFDGNPLKIRLLKPSEDAASEMSKFTMLRDGVKETYEAPTWLVDSLKNLNKRPTDFIVNKVIGGINAMARVGITTANTAFSLANLVKDQTAAAMVSKNPFATSVLNLPTFMESLYAATGKGDLYKEFIRNGGSGIMADAFRGEALKSVEKIRAGRDFLSSAKYTITNPSELFRMFEDTIGKTETLTRMMQYNGTKKALLKKGVPKAEAEMLAAKAARENTVNFMRSGDISASANALILFFNAGIQGTRTIARAFKERPAETSLRVATGLLLPTAILTTMNLSTPEKKKVYETIPDYEKDNNFIVITNEAKQNDDGKWSGVYKIPLPPGLKSLTRPVRKTIEDAYNVDNVSFGDFGAALAGLLSPFGTTGNELISGVMPTGLKMPVELTTNKSLYTGQNIVPSKYQNLSPELQVKPSTSIVAQKVGGLLNYSPIKVDYAINSLTGGGGQNVINMIDSIIAGKDEKAGGKSVAKAIVDRFTNVAGTKGDTEFLNKLEEAYTAQQDEKAILGQKAEKIWETIKDLDDKEVRAKIIEVQKTDKELFKELRSTYQDEKKGLTYEERAIQRLNINNGARAKFISEIIKDLPPEEKKTYLLELRQKGIVNNKVYSQITTK